MKVVSGGQTGVDRAALDAGMKLGIGVGGWCPKGRLAEDGSIDRLYPLRETNSEDYAVRTEWNVRDSDGTLILHRAKLAGGTAFTKAKAVDYGRPYLCLKLQDASALKEAAVWGTRHKIRTLNVAGPRESGEPGIYEQAYQFLLQLLPKLRNAEREVVRRGLGARRF